MSSLPGGSNKYALERARIVSKKRRNLLRLRLNPPIGGGWRRQIHYAKAFVAAQYISSVLKSWH
jgi:hypothetical protein